jgi:phage portal protein BeeE
MFGSVEKARAIQSRSSTPPVFRPPYGGSSYFGQSYHWEQILHYKYWAFIAIRAIINEIAGGAPPKLGLVTRDQNNPVRRNAVSKSLGGPKEHEKFEPFHDDHPICRLFANPNGPDVAFDLWAYHSMFLWLTGSAHWWVIRNQLGIPVEIWVIPTHWMRLATGSQNEPLQWLVQSPWGQQIEIPYKDVVSFYQHSPLNRYEGYSPSLAVSEWIDAYESLTRMRIAVFKNGAMPAMHVQLGEAYSDPDDAFLARFYAKWFARFQGENNSGKPVITGADVTIKGVDGHRPADALAASNASEEHIRDMVLAAYGVPKGIVGLEPLADTSAYAPQRAFTRFTINPALTYMGQVITEKVLKPTPGCEDAICYWESRVPDDPDLLERQMTADIADGTLTPNEKRSLRGREKYPHGGDDPILNGAPMHWQTGEKEDDGLTQEFKRALGSDTGAAGGYLVKSRVNGNGHR